MPLDMYDLKPEGMVSYLRYNGYHFSKKMCEWAVSLMYKYDSSSKRDVSVSFWDKKRVNLLTHPSSLFMNYINQACLFISFLLLPKHMLDNV